jgi:signal peptidase I
VIFSVEFSEFFVRKAKKVLFQIYAQFKKKESSLPATIAHEFHVLFSTIETAILGKHRDAVKERLKALEHFAKLHLRKTPFETVRGWIWGIAFALLVAVVIRQMWFELYMIPSGSMRPTFKEQDLLSVTKTAFGVNIPLSTGHLYFDQNLMRRGEIVIFTVAGMDFPNSDMIYFYLFPGKKQLVKRLIGKPGDTLYFYGGKIYGIDREGRDITSELDRPELQSIDHVPFIHFEGKVGVSSGRAFGVYSPITLAQMNEPIARLSAVSPFQGKGELLPSPLFSKETLSRPDTTYADLFGMGNFATARLLTKDQVKQLTDQDPALLEEGVLYLELRHHPSLTNIKIGRDEWNRPRPILSTSTSIIPLQEKELENLFHNLYTGRFVVNSGFAQRYSMEEKPSSRGPFTPHLPGVPDGTYEFFHGRASKILWGGITQELSPSHPLCQFDPGRLQLLFNMGIEFDTRFSPQSKEQGLTPARFAYFLNSTLYTMGAPLLDKESPSLARFVEREARRQSGSRGRTPYVPFLDAGAPLLPTGELNTSLVRKYGFTVPEKGYFLLGDNYANSGDSREFGFVPEANLRGSPSLIFWPPSHRLGPPVQPTSPLFNPGRIAIWAAAGLIWTAWWRVQRRRKKQAFPNLF